MKRANDIKDKLAFALLKLDALKAEISAAQAGKSDVPFIGQKAGDILSACRECFDYCARDIADKYVATSSNAKAASRYTSGKAKAYFPFYSGQLSNGSLFDQLTTTAPQLHQYLLDVAAKIAADQVIPGTVVSYKIATELNDLVNAKKHDQITAANIRDNAATQIFFPNGGGFVVSPMFPFNENQPDFGADLDAQPMSGSDGVEIQYVKEYRLASNNWEITRFCLHAIQGTKLILTAIYENFFDIPADYLDPWETIKPPKVKAGENALKAVSPIATRPLRVVLLLDAREVANVEIGFDGTPATQDVWLIWLANLFLILFEKILGSQMQRSLENYILANSEQIETHDPAPRYWEVTKHFPALKSLTINGVMRLSFNCIVWGLGSKFRCGESIMMQPDIDLQSIQEIASLLDDSECSFSVEVNKLRQVTSCKRINA